jgi:hypothetical protein
MKRVAPEKPREQVVSRFRIALWATVIPIVGLSFSCVVVTAIYKAKGVIWYQNEYGFVILDVAGILWVIALVTSIFYSFRGKREIAKGIWLGLGIGLGIGILSLIVSFFMVFC